MSSTVTPDPVSTMGSVGVPESTPVMVPSSEPSKHTTTETVTEVASSSTASEVSENGSATSSAQSSSPKLATAPAVALPQLIKKSLDNASEPAQPASATAPAPAETPAVKQAVDPKAPPKIVIIGGGIVGLILASGLHRRSIPVQIYERSTSFRESGAGIGFNIAAKSCMEMIDPAVITALRLCGGVPISALDPEDPHDYLRWVDGYSYDEKNGVDSVKDSESVKLAPGGWQKEYLKADAGFKGIEGTRRDHFLDQMGTLFPRDMIHFGKELSNIIDPGNGSELTINFADGSSTTADAVIGCDGIRSKTREFVLTPTSPPSKPTFSNMRAYRVLLPFGKVVEALGPVTASIYHNHMGPGANLLHYPVAANTLVNIAMFIHDPEDWAEDASWTAKNVSAAQVQAAFKDWHPRIQKLVSFLPETVPGVGVFDMFDHPMEKYNNGRIAVAGDAAHASSPHHGAGAGMGIEDALALSILIAEVATTLRLGIKVSKADALATALAVYDGARRPRSQWLVASSRRVCDLQHSKDFGDPAKKLSAETGFEEIMDRTLKIWNFDFMGMVRRATEDYGRRVNQLVKAAAAAAAAK